MFRINENVVREIAIFEQRDAAAECRAQHEAIVRLPLHDMPHAKKLRIAGESLQLPGGVLRLQIDPANHARDERMCLGHVEQPSRFVKGLARLYRHAGIDSRAIHFAAQIGRQKIPAQRGHRVVYPSVLGGSVVPEMLMGVYSHVFSFDAKPFRSSFRFRSRAPECRPTRSTNSTLRRAPSS